MAEVSYVNATCIYPNNPVPAVNDLDLDIADGEFMVLVGPSGSGKSTALRMLAGLEEITRGRILIGERVVVRELERSQPRPTRQIARDRDRGLGPERSERDVGHVRPSRSNPSYAWAFSTSASATVATAPVVASMAAKTAMDTAVGTTSFVDWERLTWSFG